jgi:hypothetical protein
VRDEDIPVSIPAASAVLNLGAVRNIPSGSHMPIVLAARFMSRYGQRFMSWCFMSLKLTRE